VALKLELAREPRVEVAVPKETLKEVLEYNPGPEAVEACMKGKWALRWAEAVTGMTVEQAKAADLSDVHREIRRRLCTRLIEALYE